MTSFDYKARDRYGILAAGQIDADDTKAAIKSLQQQGYTPVLVTQVEVSWTSLKLEQLSNFLQAVTIQELIVFTRQLASVLEAGVPLIDGLDAVAEQVKNHRFQTVIKAVKHDIDGGSSFSEALDRHRDVFSALMVNMVKAGESAGILPEVLDRVSNLLDKEAQTADKIKSATRYPMLVVGTLGIAFVVLTVYVIPKFSAFFSAFKAELPLPTRILINMNYLAQNYWYWFLLVIFGSVYGIRSVLKTEAGRYGWDKLILSMPVFGPLFLKINMSRFSLMLASMLGSGIPILEALTITAATVDNKVIARVILDVRNQVSQGKSLAEPMRGSEVFPPIAISMVSIGEKAGTLEKMLMKVAEYFDRESDYTIQNLTPLIEPMMIFGLGMVLLLFAMGILLPMWEMINVYKT